MVTPAKSISNFPAIVTDEPETCLVDLHCADVLKNVKERQDLCDVTLKAGDYGKRISAHRLILIGCSFYFASVLGGPKPKRELTVHGMDGEALENLINYCYTGQLEFEGHTIEALLTAARQLHLQKAVDACCDFIERHLTTSNCLDAAFYAEQENIKELMRATKDFVRDNFREVSCSPEFLLLNSKALKEFVASDKLDVPSEEFVFKAIMKWIEYDPANRRKHFSKLLPLLRLTQMSPTFLCEKVEPLCNTRETQKLVSNALKSYEHVTKERACPKDSESCLRVRTSNNETKYLLAVTEKRVKDKDYFRIEAYDFRTRSWTSINTKIRYRPSCTIALVKDNLMVVGGENSSKVTVINLRTLDLSELAPLLKKRWCHRVAELSGMIYVIGGYDGYEDLNSVERWDPDDGIWSLVSPMKTARRHFGVSVLNGYLYASGGMNKGDRLASLECYDPFANTWTIRAPMKSRRTSHGLAAYKGYLYAIGGYQINSVERYNPYTDNWTLISYSPSISQYDDIFCSSFGPDMFLCTENRVYDATKERNSDNLKLRELCELDVPDLVAFCCYVGELGDDDDEREVYIKTKVKQKRVSPQESNSNSVELF